MTATNTAAKSFAHGDLIRIPTGRAATVNRMHYAGDENLRVECTDGTSWIAALCQAITPDTAAQAGDLVSYAHPTQHRTLIGTIVRLESDVPHIRLKGKRTVFQCLSGEGIEILPGHDPEPAPACRDCKGAGTDWWHKCGCAHGCELCDGAGHMGVFACPTCQGTGDAQ